ncbi:MAG TPA: SAM-dependent methyltransferase [Chromatiales bacterium]|nr:SAM-dependent methyltransferase [Chromatiales bacterium]
MHSTRVPTTRSALASGRSSADLVVGTLVLCTVDDPERVLAEVRRVLRPGGRFVFVEHIAAEAGSGLRRVQEAVHGAWHWCFEGCNTQRETDRLIEAAGFREVRMEHYRLRSPFLPVNPQIAGVAVK